MGLPEDLGWADGKTVRDLRAEVERLKQARFDDAKANPGELEEARDMVNQAYGYISSGEDCTEVREIEDYLRERGYLDDVMDPGNMRDEAPNGDFLSPVKGLKR